MKTVALPSGEAIAGRRERLFPPPAGPQPLEML